MREADFDLILAFRRCRVNFERELEGRLYEAANSSD